MGVHRSTGFSLYCYLHRFTKKIFPSQLVGTITFVLFQALSLLTEVTLPVTPDPSVPLVSGPKPPLTQNTGRPLPLHHPSLSVLRDLIGEQPNPRSLKTAVTTHEEASAHLLEPAYRLPRNIVGTIPLDVLGVQGPIPVEERRNHSVETSPNTLRINRCNRGGSVQQSIKIHYL